MGLLCFKNVFHSLWVTAIKYVVLRGNFNLAHYIFLQLD